LRVIGVDLEMDDAWHGNLLGLFAWMAVWDK
jgi:hypothetical protein